MANEIVIGLTAIAAKIQDLKSTNRIDRGIADELARMVGAVLLEAGKRANLRQAQKTR
jgi:hypothetical protein